MLIYKNYKTIFIFGLEINLISEIVGETRNTVAEINNQIYYLGAELDNIATAIFIWQELNKKELNEQELRQVMIDNNIL